MSDLLKRALALDPAERAALANTLLESTEASPESVRAGWDREIARRMDALAKGEVASIPWQQVHSEMAALLNDDRQG
jgi:putative addiction module component (TIGR02574 family)